jgi:hypothetical protein
MLLHAQLDTSFSMKNVSVVFSWPIPPILLWMPHKTTTPVLALPDTSGPKQTPNASKSAICGKSLIFQLKLRPSRIKKK